MTTSLSQEMLILIGMMLMFCSGSAVAAWLFAIAFANAVTTRESRQREAFQYAEPDKTVRQRLTNAQISL